jgi:exosome complex component RRP42
MNEERKNHLIRALENNMRFDGRACDDYRDIKIELDVSKTAEGSAKVTIGDTIVIAGVKLGLETPYPDTPDQGNLMVNTELLPMSSNEFESGPPSIDSIEMARVIDRSIRESQAIDIKKLCVEEGEKVWSVMCDVCTVNDAGNLFDAASIAAVTALKEARFPEIVDGVVDYKKKTDTPLPVDDAPVAITVWKIGDKLIVDPLPIEEKAFDARLTVASRSDGKLCALQKGGEGALTKEAVDAMTERSLQKAQQVRKHILASLK